MRSKKLASMLARYRRAIMRRMREEARCFPFSPNHSDLVAAERRARLAIMKAVS